VLANVFSGPTCHAVSEPMQTGWTTRLQQMPLPCGKTEEFFAREQPDDKSVEFSSTEILRYVGLMSASLVNDILYLPSCHLYFSICHLVPQISPRSVYGNVHISAVCCE
jgi:hypothetical protein